MDGGPGGVAAVRAGEQGADLGVGDVFRTRGRVDAGVPPVDRGGRDGGAQVQPRAEQSRLAGPRVVVGERHATIRVVEYV